MSGVTPRGRRKKYIEDHPDAKCSICGSTEYLSLHHRYDSSKKRNMMERKIVQELIDEKIADGTIDAGKTIILKCRCGTSTERNQSDTRKAIPCDGCGAMNYLLGSGHKTWVTDKDISFGKNHFIGKDRFKKFLADYKDEIEKRLRERGAPEEPNYLDFEKDIEVLCRRCHYVRKFGVPAGRGVRLITDDVNFHKNRFEEKKKRESDRLEVIQKIRPVLEKIGYTTITPEKFQKLVSGNDGYIELSYSNRSPYSIIINRSEGFRKTPFYGIGYQFKELVMLRRNGVPLHKERVMNEGIYEQIDDFDRYCTREWSLQDARCITCGKDIIDEIDWNKVAELYLKVSHEESDDNWDWDTFHTDVGGRIGKSTKELIKCSRCCKDCA